MRAALMLHSVDTTGSVLSVTRDDLASIVDAILTSDHRIVSLEQLLREPAAARAVAITFDDGFASLHEHAAPVLRAAGAAATVFVTTGYVGRDNRWPTQPAGAPVFPTMSWDQIKELAAQGWAVGSHSVTHPDLTLLTAEDLERELTEPRDALEHHLGRAPDLFAYPYGYLDARVVAAARRHYKLAVTTRMATLDGGAFDPLQVPRIDAYYLRSPRVHRRFGGRRFDAYLALRSWMRRLRRHRGEATT